MKVAIIGGGPSGLVTLKYLVTAHEYFDGLEPMTVRLFEVEKEIGGTFRYHMYRDAELVSSKYLTAFSDHRFPLEASDFAAPESYLRYLHEYIDKFGLDNYIQWGAKVTSVRKAAGSGHVVYIESNGIADEEWQCDAVVVCSGLNQLPCCPDLPGLTDTDPSKLSCQVTHSHTYKGDEFFKGAKTVAVLGGGESAMDIAYQAVTHPDVEKVVMCTRNGFLVAPKITPEPVIFRVWGKPYPGKRPNKPIDTTVASLFDTMYVPPSLQRGPFLWLYYDRWIKYMFFLISGSSRGIDQWVGGLPSTRHYADGLFLVKSDKAIPYMSAQHRTGFWNKIRSFIINVPVRDTGNQSIEVKGWPTHMSEDGTLNITEGDSMPAYRFKPDRVVLATGYETSFPFLPKEEEYPTLQEARVRNIYRNIEEGFAYIGYVRPSIGAIPPLAELQAQLWVYRWLQHRHNNALVRKHQPPVSGDDDTAPDPNQKPAIESAIAPYELDYALHARGTCDLFATKRGVDHESYAYQLALDLGAAPTFSHMVRRTGWRCVYTWAMGPNFNTKFRLVGPWADPELAVPIMEGELFGVVRRTGGVFFFLTYTVLPLVLFGVLSMGIVLFQQVVAGLVWLWRSICGLRGEDEGAAERQAVRQGERLTTSIKVD